jgi:hypothetical protein
MVTLEHANLLQRCALNAKSVMHQTLTCSCGFYVPLSQAIMLILSVRKSDPFSEQEYRLNDE